MFQPNKEIHTTEIQHPCLPTWRARVDKAEKLGRFTLREVDNASHWNTCATHEAQDRYGIEVNAQGAPTDERLLDLGGEFFSYVFVHNFDACREILTAIEKRLAELRP